MQRFGPDCEERQAVMAYQFEQLWGLVLPPHMRFLLWLMIQPEEFYHHNRTAGAGRTRPAGGGGPAGGAAEAAGEDLEGGQGMEGYNMATGVPRTGVGRSELWPLLCQELSLTQEQEDKVREVQRRLRSNKEAWAEQVRHLPAFLLVPLNCPRIMIPTYCCSLNAVSGLLAPACTPHGTHGASSNGPS